MNIGEIFDIGKSGRTYRRIDPDFNVDIFLGYNDDGHMSMVIAEPGKETSVRSSKFINASLKRREDGKLSLAFDLLDDSYKTMFLLFCKDIIVVSEKAGSNMAISSAVMRWKYWKSLFGSRRQNILDKMEIKGLVGELLQLKDYFIPKYGQEKGVASWMGPLSGHKDFEIDETWYEIKSVNENALQVTISSLEQLDSGVDGHLVVSRLEETSTVSGISVTLNKLVLQITDIINDPDTMDLFITRLGNMGYEFDEEYDKYNYIHKGTEVFSVTEGFPRLTRRDLPNAVGNVKYTLILNALSEFKEQ